MGTVLLVLIDLACLLASGTARENAAWEPGLEARVDAIERNFEAELQQAEDRMRSELEQMKGELDRMGGRLDRCESATATSAEPEIGDSGGQKVDLDLEDTGPGEHSIGQPSATSMPEQAAGQSEKPVTGTVLATMAEQVAELTANVTRIEKFCAVPSRQRQLQAEDQCEVLAVNSMLTVCCSSGIGHRRQLQGGCSSFPPSCSPTCAVQFVPLYEGCPSFRDQIAGIGGEGFFASCNEAAAQTAMNRMQPVEVRMYRISVSSSSEAEQQAALANDGAGPPPPPFGPVNLPSGSACWSGAYTAERCCDVTNGRNGDDSCWSGTFDFQFCCPPSSDVEQYHAQCTTANILTCVPACNATTHGYELLATIDGTDTKFSCNVANLLFSWIGAAALGGFLGQNVNSFVSAVISGAAGTYVLTLVEDAGVSVDLATQPGQHVIIAGDPSMTEPPAWGSGGFAVRGHGELSFRHISLRSSISVLAGGKLAFRNANFGGTSMESIRYSADESGLVTANKPSAPMIGQCFMEYAVINDDWRMVANGRDAPGQSGHCDANVMNGNWFRFEGSGDGLPIEPPGENHCGTAQTGWFTSGCTHQDQTCSSPGVYPAPEDGVVQGMVCFAGSYPCMSTAMIEVSP